MPDSRLLALAALLSGTLLAAGCGTTRSTDTSRTATEQLLVSDAIDRTVERMTFHTLAGQKVFLDDKFLDKVIDKEYLVSTLRQHLLASGCILTTVRDEATYIVEARAGSVGTNKSEVLYGVPQINLPMAIPGVPSTIPEIPFVKKTNHRGVAKIGVFAYHREAGTIVMQSGLVRNESDGRDTWVLGAGPFQRGTIHEGTTFAGGKIPNPLDSDGDRSQDYRPQVPIGAYHDYQRQFPGIHRLPTTEDAPVERTVEAPTGAAPPQ